MKLYKIPQLYCPFPSVIHADMGLIEEHTNKWVLDFELITSYDMLDKYRKQKFAAMIARSYPYGEFIDLCAWCDLNTLLFIVDDLLDEQDIIKDQESFLKIENDFLDVLENNKKCTLKQDGSILTALYDFWQRMNLRSSHSWKAKFIQGIKDMFAGGMWQFKHVMNNQLPDLQEYIRIRQYLGAANLATESLEVTGKVQLSESVYKSPMVHKLTEIARNAVCFANDLFSLSKEIAQSNGNTAEFNLVSIIRHKNKISIEEAIKEVANIHDTEVKEFVEIAPKAKGRIANTMASHLYSCSMDRALYS